jgi:hypothetical protein
LANKFRQPKFRNRHLAVQKDSEREILELIEIQAKKYKPIRRTDLRHYCEAKCSHSVSRGLIDCFILRHYDNLTESKSMSQEYPRLEVPRAFLDETICCLREYIQEMKTKSVINLDEVGMSEREDRDEKKVIVPKTTDGQMIHHRASRNVKHILITTYIIAREKSMTPYIMIS